MKNDEDLIEIDLETLSGLVRAASQNPRLVVHDWQAQRLRDGFQLNSSICRLQGHALEAGNLLPWSLVLKVIRSDPVYAAPQEYC